MGIVWVEAHGDFNAEATTPSGYLGCMPLALAVGVARESFLVHYDLKHGALLEHLGRNHLLASVDEAVTALQRHP